MSKAVQENHRPFFMSFSLLKIFPVSVMMKASPFSQRLSTETPARAAPTIVFRASVERKKNGEPQCGLNFVSVTNEISFWAASYKLILHYRLRV